MLSPSIWTTFHLSDTKAHTNTHTHTHKHIRGIPSSNQKKINEFNLAQLDYPFIQNGTAMAQPHCTQFGQGRALSGVASSQRRHDSAVAGVDSGYSTAATLSPCSCYQTAVHQESMFSEHKCASFRKQKPWYLPWRNAPIRQKEPTGLGKKRAPVKTRASATHGSPIVRRRRFPLRLVSPTLGRTGRSVLLLASTILTMGLVKSHTGIWCRGITLIWVFMWRLGIRCLTVHRIRNELPRCHTRIGVPAWLEMGFNAWSLRYS